MKDEKVLDIEALEAVAERLTLPDGKEWGAVGKSYRMDAITEAAVANFRLLEIRMNLNAEIVKKRAEIEALIEQEQKAVEVMEQFREIVEGAFPVADEIEGEGKE